MTDILFTPEPPGAHVSAQPGSRPTGATPPPVGRPSPRVVGLDLSLTATGIAYRDGTVGTIKTRPADRDRRLTVIRNAVAIAVRGPMLTDNPNSTPAALVVIEDLPTHAKSAGITGMVHGVVRELLAAASVPYVLLTPATLKKFATGKGNADKTAMAIAALKRGDVEFADDNQCDAWWLRAAGLTALGHPPVELPRAQREALDRIDWPAVNP